MKYLVKHVTSTMRITPRPCRSTPTLSRSLGILLRGFCLMCVWQISVDSRAMQSKLATFPFRLFGFGSTFHHTAFSFGGHARALRDRTLPSAF
jgi:hypothetical protein